VKIRLNFKTVKEEAISACITGKWSHASQTKGQNANDTDELADDSRLSDSFSKGGFRIRAWAR
jgi:hypothetical protein